MSSNAASKSLAPPPGLDMPEELKIVGAQKPSIGPESGAAPLPEKGQHQVLLVGVPIEMFQTQMARVIIQQAGLAGAVARISTRPGPQLGEVVLTLTSFAAALQCVNYFHGCHWGEQEHMVSAYFVNVQDFIPKVLSAEAATFVPASTLSGEAPEFMPAAKDDKDKRWRMCSDGTTASGSTSDTASDNSEPDVVDWQMEPTLVAAVG